MVFHSNTKTEKRKLTLMFSYLDVTKRTQLLLWKSLVKNDK